jgi:hypothetical protein
MNLQSTIDQIASTAGLEPAVAERATGIILSVIQQEIDPALATKVFGKLPGATELAATHAVDAANGGFLSSIAGSVLGNKAGVLAAGFSQLQGTGLSLSQIETAGATLLTFVKANAGSSLAGKIATAIPGLSKTAA